jgi:uncharacterized protein (TIGR02452 family)
MKRSELAQLGKRAVTISHEGRYQTATGTTILIADDVRAAAEQTHVIRPGEWTTVVRDARGRTERAGSASIQVTGETTLAAARRMVEREGTSRLLVLNFASAKNPGGGFVGGSRAQEESLARSSALYATLVRGQVYYDENRRCRSTLYTDHAILSPDVPVFCDEAGTLLDRPYRVTFFTMPAVNVGALKPGTGDHQRVENVMRGRIEKLLALSVVEQYEDLLLGAWGCGVFRNDPALIARLFHEALFGPDRWAWKLRRVVFAVFDPSRQQENLRAFEQAFEKERVP